MTRAILGIVVLTLFIPAELFAEAVKGPNSEAPPEVAQFGFLVGEWDCTTRSMKTDGSGFSEGKAKWSGECILDGWAIQGYWVAQLPNGKTVHGTNIRSFNPKTEKWDNQWVATGSLQWVYFEAQKIGDTMVMIGGEGSDPNGDYIDRNIFYEIGTESWRWRKDRSYYGGNTWFEGVAFIEATKVKR